jgi:ABC-type transporter Mla subunit MlaD
MKKLLLSMLAVIIIATIVWAAAPVRGTVTAVDGNKVTVEMDKAHDMKVGDKVRIENGGADGKFGGGGGMQMRGC